MVLWISFAVLTACVLAVVLRPILHAPAVAVPCAPELSLFKEQLADLDRQLAAGQMAAAEHAVLHQEVARRILRLEAQPSVQTGGGAQWSSQTVLGVIGTLVPVATMGSYLLLGSPGVPQRPFAASQNALADASVADLIAKVEARLAANPADGQGWNVVAPVYFKLERFADAANAYAQANRLLGETPQRLAGFAESSVIASDGIVTEPARIAYEKLAQLAPDRIEPRFWLALAKEQDGSRQEAATEYRALLSAPGTDPKSRALIEERLAAVTGPQQRGPTASDVAAAQNLDEGQRRAMIEGMVDNLAQRLKKQGRDAEGWQRLINAYIVLGDHQKASGAVTDARAALAGDAGALAAITELSRRIESRP